MGKSINTADHNPFAVKTLSQIMINASELKLWLEKETGSILTPVQAKAQDYCEQIQIVLLSLSDASKMLLDASQKEIDKRNMKVFNRARALNKLAGLFMDRLKKLKVPEQVSFDSLSAFESEFQKTLHVTEVDIRNWFPRLSPFFIMDRRKFLTVFEKTRLTANALTDFLNKEYVRSKTLEKTFQLILNLQDVEGQLSEVESAKAKLGAERLQLEKELAALEQETVNLKATSSIKRARELEAEAETLNTEVKQLLNHLQKPFLKLQALAKYGGGGGITPEELKTIGLYMDDPFEAVITDKEGLPTLRAILKKLVDLMAEGKLKLKPDKQRKAEQAITEILESDHLVTLQTRSLEVNLCKKKLLSSEELEEAKKCVHQCQHQIEMLTVQKGNIEADDNFMKTQRQELLEKLVGLKQTIQSNIQGFMGKQIHIQ